MRTILVALLSFLLLGMQHETLVHAFQHDAARLNAGKQSLTGTAAEGSCVTCVLNAGGSNAVVTSAPAPVAVALGFAPVLSSFRSGRSPAPVYYSTRAPPVPA